MLLFRLGKVLLEEKFEHSEAVAARESDVDKLFAHMNKLSAEKQEVLDDALAREQYKEKVRGWAQQHVEKHKKLAAWLGEKKAYLEHEEKIGSVRDAQIALSLLSAYEDENKSLVPASVPSLQALGVEINKAEFKTKHSDVSLSWSWMVLSSVSRSCPALQWKYEKVDEVKARESHVDESLTALAALNKTKRAVLEDALANQQFRDELRLLNAQARPCFPSCLVVAARSRADSLSCLRLAAHRSPQEDRRVGWRQHPVPERGREDRVDQRCPPGPEPAQGLRGRQGRPDQHRGHFAARPGREDPDG